MAGFCQFIQPPRFLLLQIVGRKGDADGPDVPRVHLGACNSRYRLADNRHLNDLAESIMRNVGDLADDVNESGSSRVETPVKSSDASARSQRSHSTLRLGKPATWGRATA